MEDLIGLNPEQMQRMATVFSSASSSLAQSRNNVTGAVAVAWWSGSIADRFRAAWAATMIPKLTVASLMLEMEAFKVRRQLEQQIRTSNDAIAPIVFGGTGEVDLDDPQAGYSTDRDKKRVEDDLKKHRFTGALFPGGAPQITDIGQGALGDCWLMAAIAAMANSPEGRQRLTRMIVKNPDGTYTVSFQDGVVVTVDGDLYVRGNGTAAYAEGEGNWVQILEKAYAQRSRDGYDSMVGGWQTDALKAFGYDPTTLDLRSQPSNDSVVSLLRTQLGSGKPVTASGPSGPNSSHAYAVYDVDKDYVYLYNPWGSAFTDANDEIRKALKLPGSWSDYTVGTDGRLRIPISDFVRGFSDLEYAK